MLLIQIYRDDGKTNGGRLLQVKQYVQQGVGVFTAGQTHHNLVAFFNHIEIGNGLTYATAQTFVQFIQIILCFSVRCVCHNHYYQNEKGAHYSQQCANTKVEAVQISVFLQRTNKISRFHGQYIAIQPVYHMFSGVTYDGSR